MGSAHLLDLAEAERLFRIYPLFDDNAMTIMETMKVPLLNQISQMSRLQSDLHLETSKGDFATLVLAQAIDRD